MSNPNEFAPHAEKEFGRLTHAIGRTLPTRLRAARRVARRMAALAATPKGRRRG